MELNRNKRQCSAKGQRSKKRRRPTNKDSQVPEISLPVVYTGESDHHTQESEDTEEFERLKEVLPTLTHEDVNEVRTLYEF